MQTLDLARKKVQCSVKREEQAREKKIGKKLGQTTRSCKVVIAHMNMELLVWDPNQVLFATMKGKTGNVHVFLSL